MSEENQVADPQGEEPQAEQASGSGEQKTYTESEINAMVTARLAKQEKSLRKKLSEEMKREAAKEQMSEVERLQAEIAERDKRLEEATAEARRARLRTQLAGKVSDLDYAMFKLEQAEDQFVGEDDTVNVDAFLKANETLVPQPTPKRGPAPTTAGGGSTQAQDMNSIIRQKAGRG